MMDTKYITYQSDGFSYPVGRDIDGNKEVAIKMAKAFSDIEEFKGCDLSIVCRGESGAIIATIFAMVLPNKCRIFHVKKDGESSHNNSGFFIGSSSKIIIVDDFICSGTTIEAIYSRLIKDNTEVVIDCICVSGRSHQF